MKVQSVQFSARGSNLIKIFLHETDKHFQQTRISHRKGLKINSYYVKSHNNREQAVLTHSDDRDVAAP